MISPSPNTKVYIYAQSIDFRKGIDGLGGVCKYELNKDPLSGSMFVFTNRGRSALKILYYDGQGFWIYHKRLSRGQFNWWPSGELCIEIASRDLNVLIWNGNPENSNMQSDWKSIMT